MKHTAMTLALLGAIGCGGEEEFADISSAVGAADILVNASARQFDATVAEDGTILVAYVEVTPNRDDRLVILASTNGGANWTTLWRDLTYRRIGSVAIAAATDFTRMPLAKAVHVAAQLVHTNYVQQPSGQFVETSQQESIALLSGPSDRAWGARFHWANVILPRQPTIAFSDFDVDVAVLPPDTSKQTYKVGVSYVYPEAGQKRSVYFSLASDPRFDNFDNPNGAFLLAGPSGNLVNSTGDFKRCSLAGDPWNARALIACDENDNTIHVGELSGVNFDRPRALQMINNPASREPSIATFQNMTYLTVRDTPFNGVSNLNIYSEDSLGAGFRSIDQIADSMSRADLVAREGGADLAMLKVADRNGGVPAPAAFHWSGQRQLGAGFNWTLTRASDGASTNLRPRTGRRGSAARVVFKDKETPLSQLTKTSSLFLDP